MTDAPTRHGPGSAAEAMRAVASVPRCGTPLTGAPASHCQAPAPPTDPDPVPASYDRVRWEQVVMADDSPLHAMERLVALVLAHYAPDGRLPADGFQHSTPMGARTGLSPARVRVGLRGLEKAGFISRPPMDAWENRPVPRPVTLTLPSAHARTEPPHTGEAS